MLRLQSGLVNNLSITEKNALFLEAERLLDYFGDGEIKEACTAGIYPAKVNALIRKAHKERSLPLTSRVKKWLSNNLLLSIIMGGLLFLSIVSVIAIIALPFLAALPLLAGAAAALISIQPIVAGIAVAAISLLSVVGSVAGLIFTSIGRQLITWFGRKTGYYSNDEDKRFKGKLIDANLLDNSANKNDDLMQHPKLPEIVRVCASIRFLKLATHSDAVETAILDTNKTPLTITLRETSATTFKALSNVLPWINVKALHTAPSPFTHTRSAISHENILSLLDIKQIKSLHFDHLLKRKSVETITKATHLKSLEITATQNLTNEICNNLSNNKTLVTLSIKKHHLSNGDFRQLGSNIIAILKNNNKLTSLKLSGFEVTMATNRWQALFAGNLNLIPLANLFTQFHIEPAMLDDIFKHNFYLQALQIKDHKETLIRTDRLDDYLERNKKLAEPREKARKLLRKIEEDKILLTPAEFSRLASYRTNNLLKTTNTLLANTITEESLRYQSEMKELADQIHLKTAEWIEKNASKSNTTQANMEFACKHFLLLASDSQHYQSAHHHAFTIAYNNYIEMNAGNQLSAFFDALPTCLNNRHQFIQFSNEQNARVIDGILLDINGFKGLPVEPLAPKERLALLQYGFIQHACDHVLSDSNTTHAPIIVAKIGKLIDSFKRFQETPIDYKNTSFQEKVNALWKPLCEAEGAMQEINDKILILAISAYAENIAKEETSLLKKQTPHNGL